MKHFFFKTLIVISFLLSARISFAQPPFNGYARFDGIDDYLSNHWDNGAYDFTIEFFYRTCDTTFTNWISLFTSNGFHFVYRKIYSGTDHFFEGCLVQNSIYDCYQGQYPADDQWIHLAFVYDRSSKQFTYYFNGSGLETSNVLQNQINVGSAFNIGRATNAFPYVPTTYFEGYMDEMRISNIKRYIGGFVPPTTPFTPDSNTVALWHFDENQFTPDTIYDVTGNGFDFIPSGGLNLIQSPNVILGGPIAVEENVATGYALQNLPGYCTVMWDADSADVTINANDSVTITWHGTGIHTLSYYVTDGVTMCLTLTGQITVDVSELTGILPFAKNVFLTYPSPASGAVYIQAPGDLSVSSFSLFNAEGQAIKNIHPVKNAAGVWVMDVHSCAEGMYFLTMQTSEGVIVKKVLITK